MSSLQENIACRETLNMLLEMVDDQPPRFWELLRDAAISRLPEVKSDKPLAMDEAEATRFESHVLQFGKWAETEVGQTPTEYLAWLADGDDFTRKVQRYVRSERFKQRQREEL